MEQDWLQLIVDSLEVDSPQEAYNRVIDMKNELYYFEEEEKDKKLYCCDICRDIIKNMKR